MQTKGVFCDTSFFLRLLDVTSQLHTHAKGYYKYFLDHQFPLYISTVAIGEYCVRVKLSDLPLSTLRIIPYNLDHAIRTGELASIGFANKSTLQLKDRNLIPNDTKLFAQADILQQVQYYASSDTESIKVYNLLKETTALNFQFLDIHKPYHEQFSLLPFKEE